jgi:hypothetical protein
MLFPVDPLFDAGLSGFMKTNPAASSSTVFTLTLRVEIPIVRGEKTSAANGSAGTGDK